MSASKTGAAVLIIGGSQGLGLAVAGELVTDGYSVTIASRDGNKLRKAQRFLERDGHSVGIHMVDVTDEPSVETLFRVHYEQIPISIFINCVGKNISSPLVRVIENCEARVHSLDKWRHTIDLCLTGVFLCGREAARNMVLHKQHGVIVNISSAIWRGAHSQSAYAAAKAGIVSLTKTWALELAEHGIRVVAIAPGVIEGEALRLKCEKTPKHAAYMSGLKTHVPLGRWATELEIAKAVTFAIDNTYVTGSTIELDGGGVPARLKVPGVRTEGQR